MRPADRNGLRAVDAVAFTFLAGDARADGGQRSIVMDRNQVLIARRLAGIGMKIRVPARAYRGIALQRTGAGGSETFRVVLEHGDRDLSVVLYERRASPEAAVETGAVLGEWNRWASFFALPKLIRFAEPGGAASLGVLRLGGGKRQRRRGATIRRRRPRFLLRRKAGAAPAAD